MCFVFFFFVSPVAFVTPPFICIVASKENFLVPPLLSQRMCFQPMLHKSNTHGRCVNITSFVCEEIFLVLFMVTILYFLRVSDDSKAYFYMINNTYVVILASCLSPNLNCSFINLIGK